MLDPESPTRAAGNPMAASNSIASSTPDQRQLRLIAASAQANVGRVRDILDDDPAWTSTADRDALRQSLQKAATRGNLELARLLLAHGAEPNASPRRENETPAIVKAAEGGHAAVIAELLAHGANPNWRSHKTGETALFAACCKGRDTAVNALLAGGAEVDARERASRTPLLYIASEKKAKWTAETLRLLVEAGADLEARDKDTRTPLIWAATTGNLELADALLSGRLGRKADTRATNDRGLTSLHLAAKQNHEGMVKLLLENGANPSAVSDGDWTALHNAAQSGHTGVIELLLQHGADVNAVLSNGMTPLHWAAFNGHEEAVKLLLTRPEADLSIKDGDYRTPMLCAAEKYYRDIVQLLSPARNASRLSPIAEHACKSFQATIVDFGDFRDGKKQLVFKPSVHELLYGWDEATNKPTHSTLTKNIKYQPNFRWIHLPANNLAWVETIVAKSFIEGGHRDIEAFKTLQRCFDQEHCGPRAHAHFMRTYTQRIPSSQQGQGGVASGSGSDRGDGDDRPLVPLTEETSEISTATSQSQATTGMVQFKPMSRAEMLSPRSENRPAATGARTPTKTESSTATSSSMGSKPESSKKKGKAEQIAERHPKRAKRNNGPPGNPPGTSRRSSGGTGPVGLPWDNTKLAGPSGRLVLFMPFLHYETNERRKTMSEAIENARNGRLEIPSGGRPTRDQLLVNAYMTGTPRLHPRRTLDQFFYHGIDTRLRDEDQVVYRYCKLHGHNELKVYMVDQLWLWVIGRDLVVTSFPQRWDKPKHDPLNVLDGIIEETNAKTRRPVQSVYDLAMLITNRCAGLFDRHRMDDQEYQFLDMFESSIGLVTHRESELFVRFNRASELSGKLRQRMMQGNAWSRAGILNRNKGKNGEAGGESGDPADELLDIGLETELLAEIKDIRDELNIIDVILHSQAGVLEEFDRHLTDEVRSSSLAPPAEPSARRAVDVFVADMRRRSNEQKRLLGTHRDDILRMDNQALSILTSLTQLLDLKQKHSNALEARFARDQAGIAARQGQTMMIFTLVTIVFLPMSFVAAFFAINFQEWGDGRLTIGYVSQYMFSIGLGISIPLVVLAFTLDDIIEGVRGVSGKVWAAGVGGRKGWRRWRRRRRRGERSGGGDDSSDEDDDDGCVKDSDILYGKKAMTGDGGAPRVSVTVSSRPRRSTADDRNGSAWRKQGGAGFVGRSPPPTAHRSHLSSRVSTPPPPPPGSSALRPPGGPRKLSVGSGGGVSWRASLERAAGARGGGGGGGGGIGRDDDDLEKGRVVDKEGDYLGVAGVGR